MRKMRYLFAILLLVLLLKPATIEAVAATSEVNLNVDGKVYEKSEEDPAPFINKNNRTMVPIRFVTTSLGVNDKDVVWDQATKRVTIKWKTNTLLLQVGSNQIKSNGQATQMDTATAFVGGRVFVPVRFVSELLGKNVEYDVKNKTVFILSAKDNNLLRYGLEPTGTFPMSVTLGGVTLTVNNVFIYGINDSEAKDLIKKYSLIYGSIGTPTYLVKMEFTVKNGSKSPFGYNYDSLGEKVTLGASWGNPTTVAYSTDPKIYNKVNGSYLITWKLAAGKSLTTTQCYYLTGNDINYLNIELNDGKNWQYINAGKPYER